VTVAIDLDRWMLLQHRADAPPAQRWIAVSAGEAGAAWHGLRAALHARVRAAVAVPPQG
jgi:hypothetical protein